jgi:hypothetical protein
MGLLPSPDGNTEGGGLDAAGRSHAIAVQTLQPVAHAHGLEKLHGGAAMTRDRVAILRAGDLVFSLQDNGDLLIFRSGGTSFEQLKKYTVAQSETWTQPTISGNRIFVKDVSNLTLFTLN